MRIGLGVLPLDAISPAVLEVRLDLVNTLRVDGRRQGDRHDESGQPREPDGPPRR